MYKEINLYNLKTTYQAILNYYKKKRQIFEAKKNCTKFMAAVEGCGIRHSRLITPSK